MNEQPIATEREWHEERRRGLGASEAAAAAGLSRWKSNVTLWEEKTGRREPEDVSASPDVQRGVREEPGIRALFAAMHPEFSVYYAPYDLIRNPEEPWYLATLDGRLYAPGGGPQSGAAFGVLEIKSVGAWSRDWEGRVPTHYLAQVLHQLHATGAAFAVLAALIHTPNATSGRTAELREYRFEREDYADQIAWLLPRERAFWNAVVADAEPPLILPEI